MTTIYHFTPAKLSPGHLEQMFVSKKGRSVLDRILSDLEKRADKSSNQHYLILGPRGIGKSHLMANLYYKIKKTPLLYANWMPLWFSEEEYSVISIRDLAEKILEVIITELSSEHNPLLKEIEAFKTSTEPIRDDDEGFKLVAAFLKDLSHKLAKKFIVIFENFNLFLKDIRSHEEKKLRSLLMNETFLLLIASAPTLHSYLKEIADPKNALYNLFDVHYLNEFTFEECRELLKQQCLLDNNSELLDVMGKNENKLRVFHRLAGGNPRLMLMFYQMTTSLENLPGIEKVFAELLERLTPYFQSRTDSLSPQSRKILITFAQGMENLTPAEVGGKIHLPTNQVTAQIGKLVEHGFLGIVPKVGQKRGTLYELSERIYRYWYQFRSGKGRKQVAGLVEFLSNRFSIDELKNLEIELQKKFDLYPGKDERRVIENQLSYIKDSIKTKENDYRTYLQEGNRLYQSGNYPGALDHYDRAIAINADEPEAYNNKGLCLANLGKHEEAIHFFDRAIKIKTYAAAYLLKANSLVYLNKFDEALGNYDKALEIEPDYIDAYNNKGAALHWSGKFEEAIRVYDQAIKLNPELPTAYYNKGATLKKWGKQSEAIECYHKVIELDVKNFKPYFWLSLCQLELAHKIDAMYHFEKGLDLFLIEIKGNNFPFFLRYIYDALKAKEYDFVESIFRTVEEKIKGLEGGQLKAMITGSLKYFKLLILYLKHGDKNILDRQPLEIRQTLKEMIKNLQVEGEISANIIAS